MILAYLAGEPVVKSKSLVNEGKVTPYGLRTVDGGIYYTTVAFLNE